MPSSFDLVTIDTPRPDVLASFWCTALGLHETEREDGGRWIVLSDADSVRRIGLQRGECRPNGMHLDVACQPFEFEDELGRLMALGARLVEPPRREPYGSIANLIDPDGNQFDLCAYRP
jgi:predicted enzyme related to lactoylglutathione lyase